MKVRCEASLQIVAASGWIIMIGACQEQPAAVSDADMAWSPALAQPVGVQALMHNYTTLHHTTPHCTALQCNALHAPQSTTLHVCGDVAQPMHTCMLIPCSADAKCMSQIVVRINRLGFDLIVAQKL